MKKGALFTTIGSVTILIISFIAFVLPSTFGSSQAKDSESFGKYNGREIRYEKDSLFSRNLQQSQNFQQALQDTVRDFAFEDMAKESGYIVPSQTVNYYIRKQYVDENGNFSKSKLRMEDESVIEALSKEINQYLYSEVVKNDLMPSGSNPYSTSIVPNTYKSKQVFGLKRSDAEINFYNTIASEKRGFDLVVFTKSEYPKEEMIKWLPANSNKFTTFDYSMVTFDSEKTATKYADKLEKNEITFDDLIANKDNQKTMTTSDGKGTFTVRYKIEMKLDNKADISIFDDLASGKTSKPFLFYGSWAIIKMNSEPKTIDTSLANEDDFNTVKDYILSYEQVMIEDYFVAKGKQFKKDAEETSFDKACAKHGLTKTIIPKFPLNYGNVALMDTLDTAVTGLSLAGTNEDFLKTAFTLKMNEISEPVILTDSAQNMTYGFVAVMQYVSDNSDTPQGEEDSSFELQMKQMTLSGYDSQSIIVDIMNDKKTDIPAGYFGNY